MLTLKQFRLSALFDAISQRLQTRNLEFNLQKIDYLIVISLLIFQSLYFYLKKPQIFQYRVEPDLIKQYMHSQDITHDVSGRIFLSDSQIHMAAGLLYARGEDPTIYNFQHPPLIKYLFGLSIRFFSNPYLVQFVFALLISFLTYSLALVVYRDRITAVLAVLILIFDRLFLDMTASALLDLGQTAFGLVFLITFLIKPKNYWLNGFFLGLLAASKFWSTALIFLCFNATYLIAAEKNIVKSLKRLLAQCFIALITFSLTYFKTFINQQGKFNIAIFQLKTLKYWFHHSTSAMFGSNIFLFLTSYYQQWWGDRVWNRDKFWSIIWTLSFLASIFMFIASVKKIVSDQGTVNLAKNLLIIFPLFFFLYTAVQAPFSRYFMVILPYLYINLARIISKQSKNNLSCHISSYFL